MAAAGLLDDGAELCFSIFVLTGSDIATNGGFGFAFVSGLNAAPPEISLSLEPPC